MTWMSTLVAVCLASPPGPAAVGPGQVGRAIAERRDRVAEFRLIKEAAEELGFRVWLFGGTAAAFAHYVRWDLAREGGDSHHRASFFDYDFTNIYRSTQDADLVVDATAEQATQLESLIKQKMSFLQGSKEHWEVRLLRQPRSTPGGQLKQPLLGNPDFLGQNTDSNSTGMVELTEPPAGEGVVRDLRDWSNTLPFFLKDVTEGRLHYYLSSTHQSTSRYLGGDNPPLFSVIRYLVKAFQYGLQVDGQDLAQVRTIIDAFDPERDHAALSPWAKGWLERYGPNLIRHSVDVEYAWNTLERLGLRAKLVSLSDPATVGTLGWWLSKEPLRTRALGQGPGKTAAELGINMVAHETSDFLAYESMTRDTTGRPNVLISRDGHPGESAVVGDGFYTLWGRRGARGTGLTIRFRVDPMAREGEDFTVHQQRVLFTNRAALTVIPESLDATLPEYFRLLLGGLADDSERGVWMKLRRRVSIKPVTPGEEEETLAMVGEAIRELGDRVPTSFLAEWFARPAAHDHPDLLRAVIDHPREDASRSWALDLFLVGELLSKPEWADHPELVSAMIGRSVEVNNAILESVLSQPAWARHPELAEALLEDGRITNFRGQAVLGGEIWREHPEFARRLEAIATADRMSSRNARRLALREVARALVGDAARWGLGVTSIRLTQMNQSDGSFNYSIHSDFAGYVLPGRDAAIAGMAAYQAVRLAPQMAGIPVFDSHYDHNTVRAVGWQYLVRRGGLLESGHSLSAAARARLERATDPANKYLQLDSEETTLIEEEIHIMMAESEVEARRWLLHHWNAVQEASWTVLRDKEGLSAAQLEAFRRNTLPVDESGPWAEVLERVGQLPLFEDPPCP